MELWWQIKKSKIGGNKYYELKRVYNSEKFNKLSTGPTEKFIYFRFSFAELVTTTIY